MIDIVPSQRSHAVAPDELTHKQRIVLMMYFGLGRSKRRIGRDLGISDVAVATHLKRATRRLARHLESKPDFDLSALLCPEYIEPPHDRGAVARRRETLDADLAERIEAHDRELAALARLMVGDEGGARPAHRPPSESDFTAWELAYLAAHPRTTVHLNTREFDSARAARWCQSGQACAVRPRCAGCPHGGDE